MGTDTKGCVVTPCKDVMLFGLLAERAITRLLRKALKERFPQARGFWSDEIREEFVNPSLTLRPDGDLIQLSFTILKEARTIHLFFRCDCDHEDLGPESVSLSLGASGRSEEYAKAILHAWSLLGPAYFDANDCDDIDIAPLGPQRITLLEAVALDYVSSYQAERIVEKFVSGRLDFTGSFKSFVGVTKAQWGKLTAVEDHSARWDGIQKVADKLYPQASESPFLPLLSAAA